MTLALFILQCSGHQTSAQQYPSRQITFIVAFVGTGSHVVAEYFFRKLAKVSVQPIPFQGGAPAINATIAGQVDLMATTLGGGAAAQIDGGKLKGIAIAADKRATVTPNIKTYVEQGYPGFIAASWVGLFAPAKTDPTVIATLNGTVEEVISDPAVQKTLKTIGFDPIHQSPSEADAYFKSEVSKWGGMVKELGLSIN